MDNVTPLFPRTTDEQYEDYILPALARAMSILWAAAKKGDHHETRCKISASLLKYVWQSLELLDGIRRSGMYFDERNLPAVLATTIDNLAADYARAIGGEESENLAQRLETRSPTKEKPDLDMDSLENE